MPKCEADHILQDQVRHFMNKNRLTISGAAVRLGVDRTTFWRFCESGRALGDTKALYREALEKCNKKNETNVVPVADDGIEADALAVQVPLASQGVLADRELKLIRKACEGLLALLDVYEAQSLGRRI
jgi:hypothetical protein